MNLARINAEIESARGYFPTLESWPTESGSPQVRYALQTSPGQVYVLQVEFPNTYPNSAPSVFVRQPGIAGDAPHRYRAGNLCYIHPTMWNPGRHDLAFVVSRSAKWLGKYEVWRRTGDWPGAALD